MAMNGQEQIKQRILNSWITVERIAEGTFRSREMARLEAPDQFCETMYKIINAKKGQSRRNSGIVLYLGKIPEGAIVDIIRNVFQIDEVYSDFIKEEKFTIALYFDKDLKFTKSFITSSGYIIGKRNIPNTEQFEEYEKELAIDEYFREPESVEVDDKESYYKWLNERIVSLITRYNFKGNYYKYVNNIDSDETNLHSFFIRDLENAKSVFCENLDRYLLGNQGTHINLNGDKHSSKFNGKAIDEILNPINYPLGRFPSNTDHPLALMQQVAVNLAIGYDNQQIRSVNGPPGTGKTTLLKDIFAELIVKQADVISRMQNKKLERKKLLWEEGTMIGIMPEAIAQYEIVVASSNHGAVKNIVDELPLLSKIDKEFQKDLLEADYFTTIANPIDTDDQNNVQNGNESKYKNWGLFSKEGGRKENIDSILSCIGKVVDEWQKPGYQSDPTIYKRFQDEYKKVDQYRKNRDKFAHDVRSLGKKKNEVQLLKKRFDVFKESTSSAISEQEAELIQLQEQQEKKKYDIQITLRGLYETRAQYNTMYNNANEQYQKIVCEKICPMAFRRKKEKKERLVNLYNEITSLTYNMRQIQNEISISETEVQNCERIVKNAQDIYQQGIAKYKIQLEVREKEIDILSNEINSIERQIRDHKEWRILDFTVNYDELQLCNPWYDKEYRKMQTHLFITALKVRKQFLWENKDSIAAAIKIWNLKKTKETKAILAAWNWINLMIPVIGTTFASVSRMFFGLGVGSIGHLFIDEAGQALPQASVGAIYRSRNVMVVGDPSQIKPVLTVPEEALQAIGRGYSVSDAYLSENASTQTLIDRISQYGYEKDNGEWIGIPLWVHRRCASPIFDISNAISYEGKMVQGIPDAKGSAEWIDIKGRAADKYVEEQGKWVKAKIKEMIEENPSILDSKTDYIYVISPFKNVSIQLGNLLEELDIRFARGSRNNYTNVGTVHTFQGKEAPVVFLVLGADKNSKAAAYWAMGDKNPNIMNVAVSRAKEKLYIVGDKELYMSLQSEVINKTLSVIDKFNG